MATCTRCNVEQSPDDSNCQGCLLALALDIDPQLTPSGLDARHMGTFNESSASTKSPSTTPGLPESIGPYRILEQIGEGGFGIVYAAEQSTPVHRKVALKVIKPGLETQQVLGRFKVEKQALAMMNHRNIAKILDAATTPQGHPYFVMELVRGIRITEYCDKELLSIQDRVLLFLNVCQAIQHAHQKGIIHRDIKPSNILVELADGQPVPKVIDFGIAKATDGRLIENSTHTHRNQFIGTHAYTSPEQAEMTGLDIDTRSDVYSLGVLLYELLAGHTPFDSNELKSMGLDAMRKTIREKEPDRPSASLSRTSIERLATIAKQRATEPRGLIRALEKDLDWIIMKCLGKDRSRRYDAASGLAADLERYLRDEPIAARPPNTLYRIHKAWRRNRLLYSMASGLFLFLTVGILMMARMEARVTVALRATEHQRLANQRAAYAAAIKEVAREIQQNHLGKAREILDSLKPLGGGELDLRGWEWRYLWGQCQSEAESILCRMPGSDSVCSITLSHRHKLIATGGRRGSGAIVWDRVSGRKIAQIGEGEEDAFVRFSADGELLVVATANHLRIWSPIQRVTVAAIRSEKPYLGAAFDSRGKTLVTLAEFGEITLWKPEGLVKLRSFDAVEAYGRATIGSLFAISPDAKRIAYPVADSLEAPSSTIQVLNLNDGSSAWKSTASGILHSLEFSPDGELLAAGIGEFEGRINLFAATNGEPRGELTGHSASVLDLVFKDARTLVSASADQTIQVWNLGSNTSSLILRGHSHEVCAIALDPENDGIVSGGKDGKVMAWRSSTGHKSPRNWKVKADAADWEFESTGGTILCVDQEFGEVRRLSGVHFENEAGYLSFPAESSTLLDCTQSLLVVGTPKAEGSSLRIMDIQNRGAILREFSSPNIGLAPIAASRKSKRLWLMHRAASDDERAVQLEEWDWGNDPHPIRSIPALNRPLMFQGDSWVYAGAENGITRIQCLTNPASFNRRLFPDSLDRAFIFSSLIMSADARHLAIPVEFGRITIWDVPSLISNSTPMAVATIGEGLNPYCDGLFSKDGHRFFASAHGNAAVTVWSTADFKPLLTLPADGEYFRRIRMSPDGNTLGAMNLRKEIHLWRAPSWEEIRVTEGE